MEIRTYQSYTTKKLLSGEIRRYPVTKTYTATKTSKLPDETINKIIEMHVARIPATKISIAVGISAERVRRVIKKRKPITNE